MVARAPGLVGCAHCRRFGADQTCPSCSLTICRACSPWWATCDRPVGRSFELPWRRELRDVDALGRLAMMTGPWGGLRFLDLRSLCWVESPHPKKILAPSGTTATPPVLTREHLVLERYRVVERFEVSDRSRRDSTYLVPELAFVGVVGGVIREREVGSGIRRMAACRSGGHVWSIGSDERLHVVGDGPGLPLQVFDPLPKKVLQAVSVDMGQGLIAAATWQTVALFATDADGKLEHRAHFSLGEPFGDVLWVKFGGSRLAAAVERITTSYLSRRESLDLHIWELAGPSGRTDRLALKTSLAAAGPADMSADGRYLAVAGPNHTVVLYDLGEFTTTSLEGHGAALSFLRFADGGRLLVTADEDRRVILRPRTATGYATAVVQVEISR